MNTETKPAGGLKDGLKEWKLSDLTPILEALRGVRYGSVELFIQDHRLVQIDRKEKIRFFQKT
jgi:hypothetical protein